jgi:hypothetical protein
MAIDGASCGSAPKCSFETHKAEKDAEADSDFTIAASLSWHVGCTCVAGVH